MPARQQIGGYYFAISINRIFNSITIGNNIVIDVDKDGKIIGIETIGREFDEEVMMEIIRSFVYPEAIILPTGRPLVLEFRK